MIKPLINFICCFVPNKDRHHKRRCRFLDNPRRRKELIDSGFTIANDILTTPQGGQIDISDSSDNPFYLVKEVLSKLLRIKTRSSLLNIFAENGFTIQTKSGLKNQKQVIFIQYEHPKNYEVHPTIKQI
jgi:hypothetical protein